MTRIVLCGIAALVATVLLACSGDPAPAATATPAATAAIVAATASPTRAATASATVTASATAAVTATAPAKAPAAATPAATTAPTPATPAATQSPAPAAPASRATDIRNFAFEATITVSPGAAVTWTNRDSLAHTVTPKSGGGGSGSIAPQGAFSLTFAQPVRFEYVCAIHASMTGVVAVQ